jgi:hypothetical protein
LQWRLPPAKGGLLAAFTTRRNTNQNQSHNKNARAGRAFLLWRLPPRITSFAGLLRSFGPCRKTKPLQSHKQKTPDGAGAFCLWRLPESNWGHTDFQSVALPAELKRHFLMAKFKFKIIILQIFKFEIAYAQMAIVCCRQTGILLIIVCAEIVICL